MVKKTHNIRVHVPNELKLTKSDMDSLSEIIKVQLAGSLKTKSYKSDAPLPETNITITPRNKTKSSKTTSKASKKASQKSSKE